ncbi:uncharacterized protein EI90DRAFT_3058461 [Cantharellus anzutake]|uniref:uncharacterized protein n=1 Tax=Cantharellus anzutake TaxID=1750568 RepID=UPI0019076F0A|nr:uncharacterized protein EI90DRAFT_3058461 [Cantharellus anzutake]KAF8331075.1 hypothetical protein EI90DRAFT_3058461 [Cantharellus anzutake]
MKRPLDLSAMDIDIPLDESDADSSSGLSDAPMNGTGEKDLLSASSFSDDDEDVPLASRQPTSDTRAQKRQAVDSIMMGVDEEPEEIVDDLDTELGRAAGLDTSLIGRQSGKTESHPTLALQTSDSPEHIDEAAAAEDAKAKAKVINSVERRDEKQEVARLATGIAIDAAAAPTEAITVFMKQMLESHRPHI